MTHRSIFITLCLALAIGLSTGGNPACSEPSVLVQVTKLRKGSLPLTVVAYGTVQPSSAAQETVVAPMSAVIGNLYVREGEKVAKDAPLVRLLPSPKTAASYAQADTALRVAAELVDRTRKLLTQHLATGQQLAAAEKSQADARSALAALKAQGAGGPNILRTPFEAIITAISTKPGAIVAEGSALLELAQPKELILKVGVVPTLATTIAPGNHVSITPIGEEAEYPGKVLLRGSVVDPGTGLVPIEIALPPSHLLPGEMAKATITTGEAYGYVVPHQAILVNDRGQPYVVQAVNMVARKVAVQILGAYGDHDVIGGALSSAAPLILAGNHQLKDGMKVRLSDPQGSAVQ